MPDLQHIPVLYSEVLEALNLAEGKIIADMTLGLGGHSEGILQQIGQSGKLIAFDQDLENLEEARRNLLAYEKQILYVNKNFAQVTEVFRASEIKSVDGFLFDLGVASVHLDNGSKGFSFKHTGPLDMRMDKRTTLTAKKIVNEYTEAALKEIFWKYGEEKFSRKIAAAIVKQRTKQSISTTTQLADLIQSVKPKMRWGGGHPAGQVFQALRIAVNRELEVLQSALEEIIRLLAPKGRIVVISYHSLEDRIVKNIFKKYAKECLCSPDLPLCQCNWQKQINLIGKVVTPSQTEIAQNPRSRSAKLRIGEKLLN